MGGSLQSQSGGDDAKSSYTEERGLLPPVDLERYLFKQRLVKLTSHLRHHANTHLNESYRMKYIYFLCCLLPSLVVSGTIGLLAVWNYDDVGAGCEGLDRPTGDHPSSLPTRNTIILALTIVQAGITVLGAFWNWQGSGERHTFFSVAFEHLLTKAHSLKFLMEQRPDQMTLSDVDSLNTLYSETGRLYEEAPTLPQRKVYYMKAGINKDQDRKLKQIDNDERKEGGIARSQRPSEAHLAKTQAQALAARNAGDWIGPPQGMETMYGMASPNYSVASIDSFDSKPLLPGPLPPVASPGKRGV